jgi:hypothetical protein
MKRIITILLILITGVACQKQLKDEVYEEMVRNISDSTYNNSFRTSAGSNGFNGASSNDFSAISFRGVRSTFDKKSLSGGGYDREVYVMATIRTVSGGTLRIQIGYTGGGAFTDYNTYNLTYLTISIINGGAPISKRETFMIYNIEGTTKWRTNRHQTDILEFDVGEEAYATQPVCGTALFTTTGYHFPTINFYPALETLNNGVWSNVFSGYNVYNGSSVGVEGKIQNPSLRPCEVKMGSGISKATGQLW